MTHIEQAIRDAVEKGQDKAIEAYENGLEEGAKAERQRIEEEIRWLPELLDDNDSNTELNRKEGFNSGIEAVLKIIRGEDIKS